MQSIVLRIIEILVALECRVHVGTATMPTVLYQKILQLLGGADAVYEVKLDSLTLQSFNRHQIYKLDDKKESYDVIASAIESNSKVLIVFQTTDNILFYTNRATIPSLHHILCSE
mgnify:CR=1 FL=1